MTEVDRKRVRADTGAEAGPQGPPDLSMQWQICKELVFTPKREGDEWYVFEDKWICTLICVVRLGLFMWLCSYV